MTANAQIVQDAQMSGDKDAADRAEEQYNQKGHELFVNWICILISLRGEI